MANIIKPKRSTVAAKVPTTAQMSSGEIAVNSTDQKIYTYDGTSILQIGAGKLSGLGDVALTGLTSGQTVQWNGTNWINTTPATTDSTKLPLTGGTLSGGLTVGGFLTVGSLVSNANNYLVLSNPGIGYGNGFTFTRGTDGAGINVIETSSDATMYEMHMSDNPDGGDMMQWRFTDWQGVNGLAVPIQTTGLTNRYSAASHTFYGTLAQSPNAFYTTSNVGGINGSNNQLLYNTLSKLRVTGTSIDITALNVAGYTGNDSASFWIKLDTTTTFAWGYGTPSGTATVSGIALSTSAVTLSNGILVTFNATTGTIGDAFTCRVWKKPSNSIGALTVNGALTSTSTVAGTNITTAGNVTGTAINVTGTVALANGGTGATDAATARTNLGAYAASNPSGYTTNTGTVTSVAGTGTISGITLSGTVSTSGNITLGGTLAVTPSNFASQTMNTVLAAPQDANGVPTFRNIHLSDMPSAWIKRSVACATTAALTLNTAQTTIDGVTLTATSRVLVKDQATSSQNGIYTNLTTTSWVRAIDADTIGDIAGACVNVDAGTVNGGLRFDTDLKATDTLGTTAMLWNRIVDTGMALTAGSTIVDGYVSYNGTTATPGKFDGGTTTPIGSTRLNYGGYFYPTFINLLGSGDTATAATHYFVETGSDGFVRPKTLANVKTELVTTAAVNSAAATTVGTITSGVWNGTAIAVLNGGTGATDAATARTNLGAYAASNPSGYTTNTGTVTSVAALTLGTTGTDVGSTVATGTTTPVITLNIPTASATNRGALSSTDWSTFNNKQAALVSATNIKTVNGTSILGSGDLVVSGGSSVTIGITAPVSPTAGNLWWNSEEGKLKIYYTDANTSQWVDAFVGIKGDTGVQGPAGVGANEAAVVYAIALGI